MSVLDECVWLFLLVSFSIRPAVGYGTIVLGGLFDNNDSGDASKEAAFRFAIERVNADATSVTARVAGQLERVPTADSFHTAKRVCRLLQIGVAAVIGPGVEPATSHVQSICDTKSLPHIETRPPPPPPPPHHRTFTVNLHPHPPTLSKAYVDILRAYRWTKFYVIYENNESLGRLQDILKMPDTAGDISIIVRQLSDSTGVRSLLRSVYNSGGTHMVVDCTARSVGHFLLHAQQLGMVTPYFNYLFTTLDLHTVELEQFQFAGANISGVRLVDSSSLAVIAAVQKWRAPEPQLPPPAATAAAAAAGHRTDGQLPQLPAAAFSAAKLSTDSALVYDAVLLFARAVRDLHSSRHLAVTSLNCDRDDTWQHGDSLLNYMHMVEVDGLSGRVKFDPLGRRTQFHLDLLQLTEHGLQVAGRWSPHGVNVSGTALARDGHASAGISSHTLVVTTLLKSPYTMLKESSEELVGNSRFEGLCVDLVHELAASLGFNFTLVPVPDNAPGQYDPASGRWNGMIGELLEGRAHLAIADLTITSEREAVVDFTMQFMNLGISILYRKPTRQPPSLFSFLAPLSPYVWLYMAAATMGVSLLMFVVARFTPYEWEPPHPCSPEQDRLENNFSMPNCVWFCIGSLMQQGCDFLPKAVSTRMVAGVWWFFTLIMFLLDILTSISSYTANLAAFLTVERMVSPIESAEDLASQNKIKYGVYEKGSTAAFFKNSKLHPYNKMWRVMESSVPSVFMGSDKGIQRVKDDAGQYAYFMESSTIDYVVERECDLTQIGGLLDNKGYGIALPPGSPWTNRLNQALVTLQEQGQLARMKSYWWQNDATNCQEDGGGSLASALDLENVGGVFVCLLGGMIVASVLAVIEFVFHLRSDQANVNMPILESMWHELCAILKCRGSTKVRLQSSTLAADSDRGGSAIRARAQMPYSGMTISSTVSN